MDGQRFDNLAKTLASGISRRRIMRDLAVSATSVLLHRLSMSFEAQDVCASASDCAGDGDPCTGVDCVDGQCMHSPVVCDSGLICLDGECVPDALTEAPSGQLPAEYVGSWEGTGTQTNPEGEWTIILTISGGDVGSVAGTVDYPDLGCSGELIYLGWDHPTHAEGVMFSEDITAGEGTCVDGGTFTFALESDNLLYFYWGSPTSASTASGVLPRVGDITSEDTGSGRVMIWVMTCPESNSTETGISVTPQLINVDPGPTCYGVESPLTFTITDSAGTATTYTTAPPDSLEFDLPFGAYTITETSSGATETFELTRRDDDPDHYCDGYAGCALIIVGVPEGGQPGGGTDDLQQVTWEGLTFNYPQGHTFYPDVDAPPGQSVRAAAALQPDNCEVECPILGFHLIPNENSLNPEDWAERNGVMFADAHNIRDVTIAGQPGVAFETGNPDEYPGETSTYFAPVGTEMLEISGIGYELAVIEQIVASITVSAPTGDPALVEAMKQTRKAADARLSDVTYTALQCWEAGEYFEKAFSEDLSKLLVEAFLSSVSLGFSLVAEPAKQASRLVEPGLSSSTLRPLIELSKDRGAVRTGYSLSITGLTNVGFGQTKTLLGGISGDFVSERALDVGSDLLQEQARDTLSPLLKAGRAHEFASDAVRDIIGEYRDILKATEQLVLENLPSDLLSSAEYERHLNLVERANLVIGASLAQRVSPLIQAQVARQEDEATWTDEWVLGLASAAIIGGGFLLGGLPGLLLAGGFAIFKTYENAGDFTEDQILSKFGFDGIYGALGDASIIFKNTYSALAQIGLQDGEPFAPSIPEGDLIPLRDVDEGEAAYTVLDVFNGGDVTTDYEVVAHYDVMGPWWKPGFSQHVVHGDEIVTLGRGEAREVRVYYRRGDEGQLPNEGKSVVYEMLGTTSTGKYFVARTESPWQP